MSYREKTRGQTWFQSFVIRSLFLCFVGSAIQIVGIKNENDNSKKIPVLSDELGSRLIEILVPVKKKRTAELLSASYAARRSRDNLATNSVRVKLSSLSAAVSPVARLA